MLGETAQPVLDADESDTSTHDFEWMPHLTGALLVAVGLVPVLHRALVLGEDVQFWLVMPLALVGVIGTGYLLRMVGLDQGPGLALGSAGLFAMLSLVLIWLNLDIPGRATLTTVVAPGAAVLASLGAVAIVKWCDPRPSTWCGGFVLALAVALTSMLGPGLQESLADAEARFAVADRAAGAGLPPYRIEVPDWDVQLGSLNEVTDGDGVTEVVGYSLHYERGGDHGLTDSFSIHVEVGGENRCERADHPDRCELVEDGVWINHDREALVVVDGARMFTASLGDGAPDAEELAEAIADREFVTWHVLATR